MAMSRQVLDQRVQEATWTLNGTPIGQRSGYGGDLPPMIVPVETSHLSHSG